MAMTILQAALTFFAEKMRILLTILTTDITTYEGGVIWNAISNVYDAILAMGVTIAGVLIWFGLLSSTSRYAELKKASVWVQFLIEIVLTNAVLYYGKFLLLECIKIGQGMTEKLMNVTGMLTTNATLEMTMNLYVHTTDNVKQEEIELLEQNINVLRSSDYIDSALQKAAGSDNIVRMPNIQ